MKKVLLSFIKALVVLLSLHLSFGYIAFFLRDKAVYYAVLMLVIAIFYILKASKNLIFVYQDKTIENKLKIISIIMILISMVYLLVVIFNINILNINFYNPKYWLI